MEIFNKIVSNNDLCYDVGANNGNKTESLLSLGARVVCVEPQSGCYQHLVSKFNGNQNVNIENTALGKSDGVGSIHISQAHTLSTMSESFMSETTKERFVGNSWNSQEEVKITTLDYLISKYGIPKFCKIDVEGFEVEVLKGLSQPIPFLSIEFVPELKSNTFECIEMLSKLGDYKFNYSEGETGVFSFEEHVSKEEIIEFLSKNNDYKVSFGDLYAINA
jgi:FkbM family methyltransferase